MARPTQDQLDAAAAEARRCRAEWEIRHEAEVTAHQRATEAENAMSEAIRRYRELADAVLDD